MGEKPYYEHFDEDEEEPKKGIGRLFEHIRQHWIYWFMAPMLGTCIGVTWKVCIEIRAEPLKDRIQLLETKIEQSEKLNVGYKEKIQELENRLSEAQERLSQKLSILNSIVLKPTWIEAGKSISTTAGHISIRYNTFLPRFRDIPYI